MKTKTKALALALCAVLLVVGTVFATMAYLTSTDEVVNTFTVGQVHIILDEKDVDEDTNKEDNRTVENETRDRANAYKLFPGGTYEKDPMVTILGGSEDCYVRMLVTVHNIDGVKAAFPGNEGTDGVFLLQNFVNNTWDSQTWIYKSCESVEDSDDDVVYEFWYKAKVEATSTDKALEALFKEIKIPGETTNDDIAKLYYEIDADGKLVYENGKLKALAKDEVFKIEVVAHAIQATGFNADETKSAEDVAWEAFDKQYDRQ